MLPCQHNYELEHQLCIDLYTYKYKHCTISSTDSHVPRIFKVVVANIKHWQGCAQVVVAIFNLQSHFNTQMFLFYVVNYNIGLRGLVVV